MKKPTKGDFTQRVLVNSHDDEYSYVLDKKAYEKAMNEWKEFEKKKYDSGFSNSRLLSSKHSMMFKGKEYIRTYNYGDGFTWELDGSPLLHSDSFEMEIIFQQFKD